MAPRLNPPLCTEQTTKLTDKFATPGFYGVLEIYSGYQIFPSVLHQSNHRHLKGAVKAEGYY